MEKRSSKAETARLEGVGVRQTDNSPAAGGGGYLEIYTFSELPIRPSDFFVGIQYFPHLNKIVVADGGGDFLPNVVKADFSQLV